MRYSKSKKLFLFGIKFFLRDDSVIKKFFHFTYFISGRFLRHRDGSCLRCGSPLPFFKGGLYTASFFQIVDCVRKL